MFSFRVGDKESRSKDILGSVYEYFSGKFVSAEGKGAVRSTHQWQSLITC